MQTMKSLFLRNIKISKKKNKNKPYDSNILRNYFYKCMERVVVDIQVVGSVVNLELQR